MTIDFKQVEDVEVDGIDYNDYPDFCDAYIVSADYKGRQATDEVIDIMNDDSDFVHDCVYNHIF